MSADHCPRSALPWALSALSLVLLLITACTPWTLTVVDPSGTEVPVTRTTIEELGDFARDDHAVPLERVLYANGYGLIDTLRVTSVQGAPLEFDWLSIAETTWLARNGVLTIGDLTLHAADIRGLPPQLPTEPSTGPLDIAPTVAAVLGIRAPADAAGHAFALPRAPHIALIFLDGFGYVRYTEALAAGIIPTLAALDPPTLGLTVYPPATAVVSAAILTGAPPEVNGVADRGTRNTNVETIFDVVAGKEMRGVAIEGDALAFNMRNAEVTLSGDRDKNGSTDDNVLANTFSVLNARMPELLWVHFHGIDDAGHTYGPGAPEEQAKITEVDAAVGELLAALPPGTPVLIFADHGMHAVNEEGRLGNHGNLVARDMLVPYWAFVR